MTSVGSGGTRPTGASISAVLFDADGVVQAPPANWRASLAALCGNPEQAEDFLNDVFAAEKPCLTGAAEFAPALAAVLEQWRSGTPVADALRIWTHIEPSPEMLNLVGELRDSGTVVALATNQQSHRARFMSNDLDYGAYFDHLLYSCDLGHAKPSPEYFSTALKRVGIDPSEALFLDDHAANVSAARGCGLQAEIYHLAEGMGRIYEILAMYGLGGTNGGGT